MKKPDETTALEGVGSTVGLGLADALCDLWYGRIKVLRIGGDETGIARSHLWGCILDVRDRRTTLWQEQKAK